MVQGGSLFHPAVNEVLYVRCVQAASNTLLGHFLSLACSLWLLNVVGEGRGLRFQVGAGGGAVRG